MSIDIAQSAEASPTGERILGRVATLVAAGTAIVLDLSGDGLPCILHWGADLGPAADMAMPALASTAEPPQIDNLLDRPVSISILPEARTGWMGSPGVTGSRDGTGWATAFRVVDAQARGHTRSQSANAVTLSGDAAIDFEAIDEDAGLGLSLTVAMTESGLLRLTATLRNLGRTRYRLDGLDLALPVPPRASELLDFAGRWSRERVPQRRAFTIGTHLREGRRGRTGADAALLMAAGVPGFDLDDGELWCLHTAWSGDHRHAAERTSDGLRILRGGELLLPDEVVLEPGESYSSPSIFATWARGLDATAARFHDHLRSRPSHPRTPRPVNMNVWEAVYFDHDLDTLLELARTGARIGVERFVLDDGWFHRRSDDTAGLGDWIVDETKWPQGLHPLVDEVRRLGMGFGLWFEPEMVNPDSDVARSHPEWIMRAGNRLPPPSRHQQVLDLSDPDAYAYVHDRMSRIISEYAVDYVKWDQNRDLVEAGRAVDRRPGIHRQTLAVYRLMDELRAEFPALEIESCSSGGARIDLEILEHTDRVWASDCLDPLERQSIQRWTSQLLPLELIGTHVASERSHTTGRRHSLPFRAITAIFGHFGIECDLTAAPAEEVAELAHWVGLYRRFRPLLHSGRLVRGADAAGERISTGVVDVGGAEALFGVVAMARTGDDPPGRLPLRGLESGRLYSVTPLETGLEPGVKRPRWWREAEAGHPPVLAGSVLAEAGLHLPSLQPESGLLLHVRAV